jgi:hypothetical protein
MKSDGRLALSNEKTPAAHFINSLRLSMFSQFRLDERGRRLPPFLFENPFSNFPVAGKQQMRVALRSKI